MRLLRSTLSSLTMAAPVDVYAARARYTITKYLAKDSHNEILNSLPPLEKMLPVVPRVTKGLPVCIIGAGTAGLYTAMILASLGIPYVLLEASERVGGRLFTYKGFENAEKYDYYVSVTRRMLDSYSSQNRFTGSGRHALSQHSLHEANLRFNGK